MTSAVTQGGTAMQRARPGTGASKRAARHGEDIAPAPVCAPSGHEAVADGAPAPARPSPALPSSALSDEGLDKRRRWSRAAKLAVVAEASGPTTNMSAVARRHGLTPTHLYRWKKELGLLLGTARADAEAADGPATTAAGEIEATDARFIEVQLLNGRRLKVPADIDAAVLANLIKALDT